MERYSDFAVERDHMDDVHVVRCWNSENEETEEMRIPAREVRSWIKHEYDWNKKRADLYYYSSDDWIINDICVEMFKIKVLQNG